MRKLVALTAAAPLALLAACGDPPVTQEDLAVEGAGTGLDVDTPLEDLPPPTENALETVDFSGRYTMTGLDGSTSTLVLDKEAGTYTFINAAGVEQNGSFERLDNSRLHIPEMGSRPGYFSVADGALYRLADENAAYDSVSAASVFVRQGPAGTPAAE